MNKERRKLVSDLAVKLDDLKNDLMSLASDEQEAYDGMPEGLRNTERGEAAEQAASALQSAVDDIDNALANLEEALGA